MIPAIEKDSLEEIKNFQEQKLAELLTYISQNSPFYKRLFAGQNIDISKIKTLEDLQHLPQKKIYNNTTMIFCVFHSIKLSIMLRLQGLWVIR